MTRRKKEKEGTEEPPEPGAQPEPEREEKQPESDKVFIIPLKNFRIKQSNSDFTVDITLIEGEEIEVPKRYLQNLKTEGVISKKEV